jgi:DDE superfamily endonuclease
MSQLILGPLKQNFQGANLGFSGLSFDIPLYRRSGCCRPVSLRETALAWYAHRYGEFRAKYQLKDVNTWSMDESGVQVSSSSRHKRVVLSAESSGATFTIPSDSGSTRLVLNVEAVTVAGNSAAPLFVTQGSTPVESIAPEDEAFLHTMHYFLARTASVFMMQETGEEQLEKCFIPCTKPEANEHSAQPWRMLILDGHTSHIPEKFMVTAYLNRVCLLFLSGNTTHLLQPLDLSFLGT